MDDSETENQISNSSGDKGMSNNEPSEIVDNNLIAVEDEKDTIFRINDGNNSSRSNLNIPIGNSNLCSAIALNTSLTRLEDLSLLSSPAVSLTEIQTDFNDDIYGVEKTGATPENIKKIDDVTLISQAQNKLMNQYNKTIYANQKQNEDFSQTDMSVSLDKIQPPKDFIGDPESLIFNTMKNDVNSSQDVNSINGNELKIVEDESAAKQCRAFTIYFDDNSLNESVSASASAKYKNMVERFQSRHRRGASMSKLECGETANQPINNNNQTPQIVTRNSRAIPSQNRSSMTARPSNDSEMNRVKMRPRDRSASGIRDANKRHSWSPRSSTHELQNNSLADKKQITQKTYHPADLIQEKILNTNSPIPRKPTKCNLQTNEKTPEKNRRNQIMVKDALYINEELTSASVTKISEQFVPKSTAMKMAFDIDLFCPQPPLADKSNLNLNDDNVSETGTYTLDGDNYTEEQKELMNIDRTSLDSESSLNNLNASRPKNLPINSITQTNLLSTVDNDNRGNVLEVNYYHDAPTNYRPKTSYLEKLKIQMRGITKTIEKQKSCLLSDSSPEDLGTFTSITTSGVLSKKTSLDLHPKLGRKDSLSKSLIDSSEFVSSQRQEKLQRPYSGGYTDHQKAEYCFNALRNQTDSQILNAIEIPQTLDYQTDSSDTNELKTAKSKNDWIQAWARNARARSVSSAIKDTTNQKQLMMTSQHLQCETGEDDMSVLTDDGLMYRNKQFDQFRLGDFDYLSDPNVSQMVLSPRPPKSPSKIPSPMHSIGRARASRNRGSLQNILQCDTENDRETDVYLLNTAIAISNFTKNLSRKNSLKSPPSSLNSPKGKLPHQFNTNDEHNSPRISNSNEKFQPINFHKRNLSLDYRTSTSTSNKSNTEKLMTNSLNEQQLNELKYSRARKNSYDSQMHTVSPVRHDLNKTYQINNYSNIDQTRELIKQSKTESRPPFVQNATQQQSPIRRSSSFSVKKSLDTVQRPQTAQRTKTNVNRNVFTPPSARHKYNQPNINSKPSIQKSSSSNCFKNMYSDYDDNIAYYINDEDDLIDDYCTAHEDEYTEKLTDEINYEQLQPIESTNNSNPAMSMARYNKALLMRIERSKQKVAGTSMANGMKPAPGGVVACPNTPELPRRANQSATRLSMRKSVPRDSSLNRLRGEIPNSLASAKKQIIQTANTVNTYSNVKSSTGVGDKKVQTKYLDISKYKPAQGANFLRKNESKITLKNDVKRSPVNISNRNDSNSLGFKNGKTIAAINNEKREATAIQKEMWKRRATYDPMKAAAEDRRRREEEKRQAMGNSFESSSVARSQSFHYGVGALGQTNFE